MSYTKTQWNNDTAPAINETNLNKIEQGIFDNDSHIGDLSDLETTANTDLVSAINENVDNIGDLTTLTTTANTDLVSAVNELDDLKATKDVATTSANGLLSALDKINIDNYVGGLVGTPLTTNLTTSFNNQANGTTQTFRFQNGATDAPSSTVSGVLISFKSSPDWGWQVAIYNSVVATRQKRLGTWDSWYTLLSKNDLNSLFKKRYLMTPLSKGPTQYYFGVANFAWDLGHTNYNVTVSSAQGGYTIDPSKFTITKYTYGFRIYTSESTYNGLVCECDVS